MNDLEIKREYHYNMVNQYDLVLSYIRYNNLKAQLLPTGYIEINYKNDRKIFIYVEEKHFKVLEYVIGFPFIERVEPLNMYGVLKNYVNKWNGEENE